MAVQRDYPYGAFNFIVNLNIDGMDPGTPLGGFSDVSGLQTEMVMAEYRNGNEKENHVRKIPGLHKVGDVTLKRGIVGSLALWQWMKETREKGVAAKHDVVIKLLDETGKEVQTWMLRRVVPLKYTGPTLSAKSSGDVAMEELVLSAEAIESE